MAVLYTEALNKIFVSGNEQVHAVNQVSEEIPDGKLTILRGRSGSGKTTLINLLGALDRPTSGHVFFEGNDITVAPEGDRDKLRRESFAFVFQSVALISVMSAIENVEFGLRVASYPFKTRAKRAAECLAMVGLSSRASHRPDELSGGEQQRVAIARAIAHKPKILFVDEPTANLDTNMGLKVVMLFRELISREGVSIVMTTHDPHMIELADRVYTLEDGTVVNRQDNIIDLSGEEGGKPA